MGSRCDKCVHREACRRQAELSGFEVKPFKCGCYEKEKDEVPLDVLESILIQARAGISYYTNTLTPAFTWFTRIFVMADEAESELSGRELSDITLNSQFYWDRHPVQ